MRLLILAIVMLAATEVDARRLVVRDPPMVRKCPRAKTWNQINTCLSQHYTVKVTRDLKTAKLVTLHAKSGDGKLVDHGVLLYVERAGNWQIGGRFETYGGEYVVLGLEPVKIGTASGYRLDIGQIVPTSVIVDPALPVPATQRLHRAMFCNGDSYACPEAITSCDVFVDGNAWYVFRATLAFDENMILVNGDRDRAGPHCNVSQKIYLGWVQK